MREQTREVARGQGRGALRQWHRPTVRRVGSLLVAATLLVGGACSGGDDGESSEVSAGDSAAEDGPVKDDGKRRELATGDDGAPTATELVATSAEEWAQKWAASGATGSPPDVSDVDFEKEVAVALFLGEKPTGGWRISPDVEVRTQGQFGAVIYEKLGPGDGCTTTQAITYPYVALAVKAKNLRFESTERMAPCE